MPNLTDIVPLSINKDINKKFDDIINEYCLNKSKIVNKFITFFVKNYDDNGDININDILFKLNIDK